MDLLLLGSDYFKSALRALGHHVIWVSHDPEADLRPADDDYYLPAILSSCPFRPQAVILTDDLGRRVLPTGLEETQVLKVWCGVDSPINYFWHEHFAPLFDLVLIDQKDCQQRLSSANPGRVHWLPVAVDTDLYLGPSERVAYDLAFVGVINDQVRPKRSRIINLLARKYNLYVAGGRDHRWVSPAEAARIYRQSRLVLNENLFPGLTTRLFEAMAAGTMLLTEANAHGASGLFSDGVDLALYGPEDLLARVAYYLAQSREREEIARCGHEKVRAYHDIKHRAETLIALVSQAVPGAGLIAGGAFYREMGKVFFLTGLRWPGHDGISRLIKAQALLTRAASLGVADSEAIFFLGVIAKLQERIRESSACFNQAAEAGSIQAQLALGYLALNRGARSTSLEHFRQAALRAGLDLPRVTDPAHGLSADLHFTLGRILLAVGHDLTPGFSRSGLDLSVWNAFEHFQAALSLNPRHVGALTALGDILIKYQAFTEAEVFLGCAARISPGQADLTAKAAMAGRLGYCYPADTRQAA